MNPFRNAARVHRWSPKTACRLCVEALEERNLLATGFPSVRQLIAEGRPFSRTEVVANVQSAQPLADLAAAVQSPRGQGLTNLLDLSAARVLFGRAGIATVQVGLQTGADPVAAVLQLEQLGFVRWASPNFIYQDPSPGAAADPRDFAPDDPRYSQQYHHPLMGNTQTWDFWMGHASTIVAVTDDGVDIRHQDLYDNIWVNPEEIPASRLVNLSDVDGDGVLSMRDLNNPVNQGPFKINDTDSNGRIDAEDLRALMERDGSGIDQGGGGWANTMDDGRNGYVDDLVGWAHIDNTNNPRGGSHGTHCAGIAAAHTNNGIGVAGTAGNVTLMPLRFYGSGTWTSTVVANSYTYAINNGARIMTTSYTMDRGTFNFVDDPIYREALQYFYDNGGLHINSAGNQNEQNPNRAKLDQTLYVVNTDENDRRSSSSNYGYNVDISAPGTNVLSTLPNNTYANNSGTSMAAPNVAGVAALIWSMYPYLTRDQVAAQLLGLADNIDDAQLPQFRGQVGFGRVNSYSALTRLVSPPRFKAVLGLPPNGGSTSSAVSMFQVDVANVFLPASVNYPDNWELRGAGADRQLDTADDVLVPMLFSTATDNAYKIGTNRLWFWLSSALAPDQYRFRAFSAGLMDPFGQPLDGNGDGVGGDHFNYQFTILGAGPGQSGFVPGDPATVPMLESAALFQQPMPVAELQTPFAVELPADTLGADMVSTMLRRAESVAAPTAAPEAPQDVLFADLFGSEWF